MLIVEDDSFKSDEIHAVLVARSRPPTVDIANSVSSALKLLKQCEYDLIVLDMALPSHAATPGGGAPLSLLTGGLEVLFELQSLGRQDPCVIVTQYPEIEVCGSFYLLRDAPKAIEINYEISVVGCVEYSESGQHWKSTIAKHYYELCES